MKKQKMLTIKIDMEGESREDLAIYLTDVAEKLRTGFYQGAGWDLSGREPEDEDDEDQVLQPL